MAQAAPPAFPATQPGDDLGSAMMNLQVRQASEPLYRLDDEGNVEMAEADLPDLAEASRTQILDQADCSPALLRGDDIPEDIPNSVLHSAQSLQELQELCEEQKQHPGRNLVGQKRDVPDSSRDFSQPRKRESGDGQPDMTPEEFRAFMRRSGVRVVDALVAHDNQDALTLGAGNFARVVKLTWAGMTRAAVKLLRPRPGRPELKILANEVAILKGLGYHPNIVALCGVTIDPLGIAMECLDLTLREFLDRERTGTPLDASVVMQARTLPGRFLHFAQGISSGLHHLHHFCDLAHLDVKPSNILLDSTLNHVKISDMGISQVQQANALAGGSPRYMSPETILRQSFTVQTDVWSLGMVLYEMLELGLPFPNQKTRRGVEALILAMKVPELPAAINGFEGSPRILYPAIKKLITSCWMRSPLDRPKICTIVGYLQALQGKQDQRCPGPCNVDRLIRRHLAEMGELNEMDAEAESDKAQTP